VAPPPVAPPPVAPPPVAPPPVAPPPVAPPPVTPPPVAPPDATSPPPASDPAPVTVPPDPTPSTPPAGTSVQLPPPPQAPAPRPTATIRFSGSDRPDVYLALLDLHGIDELLVTVDWTGVSVGSCERVALYGPNGRLYAQPATSFTDGLANAAVAVTANADGTWRVRHVIEIAGAPPDIYDMVGNWSADATLCDRSIYGAEDVDLE